jgi:large subunit ribosomal protein L22
MINDFEVMASANAIKGSVQKVNLVCDLVRKMKDCKIEEILLQLQFCKKRVAKDIRELLKSVVSNAENNFGMDIDSLRISKIHVGKSFALKRFNPRARGRASRMNKPFSKVKIYVKELNS